MRTTDLDKWGWLQKVFDDESLDVVFGLLEPSHRHNNTAISLAFADIRSSTTSKSRSCRVVYGKIGSAESSAVFAECAIGTTELCSLRTRTRISAVLPIG